MQLRAFTTLIAVVALGAVSARAAEENREQGAHQHGHGSFEMAIEKSTVSIALRIPGDDIVGFEHAPKTAKQKTMIEAAKKTLGDPLVLFGITKDAGCKVQEVDVHTHGYKADEKHDHAHDKPAAKDQKAEPAKDADKDDHAHDHGSFHAKYKLECAKPSAITALSFKLFNAFPRSQEIEVVAVSEKSQVKVEAKRKAPTVSLKGLW